MEERDHYLSTQYHRELLLIAANERLANSKEINSPIRINHLLERSGDLLISLSQRLKNHSTTPDLTREYV